MMFLLGYMAAPPTILVISAEAMPEMPAAARKTVAASVLRGNLLMYSLLGSPACASGMPIFTGAGVGKLETCIPPVLVNWGRRRRNLSGAPQNLAWLVVS